MILTCSCMRGTSNQQRRPSRRGTQAVGRWLWPTVFIPKKINNLVSGWASVSSLSQSSGVHKQSRPCAVPATTFRSLLPVPECDLLQLRSAGSNLKPTLYPTRASVFGLTGIILLINSNDTDKPSLSHPGLDRHLKPLSPGDLTAARELGETVLLLLGPQARARDWTPRKLYPCTA